MIVSASLPNGGTSEVDGLERLYDKVKIESYILLKFINTLTARCSTSGASKASKESGPISPTDYLLLAHRYMRSNRMTTFLISPYGMSRSFGPSPSFPGPLNVCVGSRETERSVCLHWLRPHGWQEMRCTLRATRNPQSDRPHNRLTMFHFYLFLSKTCLRFMAAIDTNDLSINSTCSFPNIYQAIESSTISPTPIASPSRNTDLQTATGVEAWRAAARGQQQALPSR